MLNSIADLPYVGITRRNHALEHATLHVLAAKYPMKMMGGHSNPSGFFIVGDVSTEDIANAASEALRRLRGGESALAIHPGCGTNLATSALLGASFAWFVMRGARSTSGRMLRLPFAFGFALLGVAISRPLGPLLQQKVTTDADVGDLRVVEVRASMGGPVPTHRVMTTG
jgi:hypothetical protein